MESKIDWAQMVKEFQDKFEEPKTPTSRAEWANLITHRTNLVHEEIGEYYNAMYGVLAGMKEEDDGKVAESKTEMLDAICDIMYILIGTANLMGFNLPEAFKRVHESNMAKVWSDGLPHRNAAGKVMKPLGWKPPVLGDLVG